MSLDSSVVTDTRHRPVLCTHRRAVLGHVNDGIDELGPPCHILVGSPHGRAFFFVDVVVLETGRSRAFQVGHARAKAPALLLGQLVLQRVEIPNATAFLLHFLPLVIASEKCTSYRHEHRLFVFRWTLQNFIFWSFILGVPKKVTP